jgi:iron complex transport system substrate-binding protein
MALSLSPAVQASPRVLSLDHCADQYVLALSPRDKIVGLSKRADDADSALRGQALGLPLVRADLEAGIASRAEVAVVNWVGDGRLVQRLRARGVEIVRIGEAKGFEDIRRNIRQVAAALGESARGEALIADMDAKLARAAGAWRGASAVYLTPAGFTAGPGTLVDRILTSAGMTNAERRPGYSSASLETLALDPPKTVVLGFFDTFQLAGDSWGAGRHGVMRRLARERAVASLPGELLGCPDWTAADAVAQLAAKAPKAGAPKAGAPTTGTGR